MREILLRFNVYRYDELTPAAKERVRQDYLNESFRNEDFNRQFDWDLEALFPNSDLKHQYDLGCCQGDGVNVYGRVDLTDLYTIHEKVPAYNQLTVFSDKELAHIDHYYSVVRACICLPMNFRYSYCICDRLDFAEDWIGELQDMDYKNIDRKLIRRFEKQVGELFCTYCKDKEREGYEYLYNISDEEMKEMADANDWEFYEDGRFYA